MAVLFAVVVGGLCFLVHPWFDHTTDGSIYLLTARALASGEGFTYLGTPFHVRPPAFSAMLASIVGEGLPDFFTINLLVSLFGAATLFLFFFYNQSRLGPTLAVLGGILLWAQPGFQRLSTQVMSDVPGAALLLSCLLVERWCSRSRSPRRELVLGLCIGLSAYVRAVLILLVPAILASRLLGRWLGRSEPDPRRRFLFVRLGLFAVTSLLVVLPWSLRNRLNRPVPPVDQTMQYSAAALVFHEDPGDPSSRRLGLGEVLARAPERMYEVLLAVGELDPSTKGRSSDEERGTAALVEGSLLLVCLLTALLRRREPAELFVVIYLAALTVYPNELLGRYALPVLLFAMPAAIEVLRGASRVLMGVRGATLFVAVLLAGFTAVTFEPRKDWEEIERWHRSMIKVRDAVDERTGPDARLGANRGWDLSVFLGRPVYSLKYAAMRMGAGPGSELVIDKYGLDTIVLMDRESALTTYFSKTYPDQQTIDLRRKTVMIYRVRGE